MADISIVKNEPIDPVDLEAKILQFCTEYPSGLPDFELHRLTPNIDVLQRAAVINGLLAKAKIDLLKSGSGLLYKLKNPDTLLKIEGADREEKTVYQIIEMSNNKGIWVRDIRTKCNLPQAVLNKILRSLETKKLIKAVKSAGAVRKKVYMLYEFEPDSCLSGGTFYSDQDFDAEFAGLLNLQCLKYLQAKVAVAKEKFPTEPLLRQSTSSIPAGEVLEHIRQLKISNVDLKISDIEMVMDTLVYDGKAHRSVSSSGVYLYRSINSALPSAGLVKVPCGTCPVIKDCRPGGIVSPEGCAYLSEWLSTAI